MALTVYKRSTWSLTCPIVHKTRFCTLSWSTVRIIFTIFRQTLLHVSGLSITHHQEVQPYVYNNWYLLLFLEDSLDSLLGQQTIINKYQFFR